MAKNENIRVKTSFYNSDKAQSVPSTRSVYLWNTGTPSVHRQTLHHVGIKAKTSSSFNFFIKKLYVFYTVVPVTWQMKALLRSLTYSESNNM